MTNLAFLAAGLRGVREVRRRGTGTFAEVLARWVVAIGIGPTAAVVSYGAPKVRGWGLGQ